MLFRLRITHNNDFGFRITLQAHSDIIQSSLADVIRTSTVQDERAFADFAGLWCGGRRLYRHSRGTIARAMDTILRASSHGVGSRSEARSVELNARARSDDLPSICLPTIGNGSARNVIYNRRDRGTFTSVHSRRIRSA